MTDNLYDETKKISGTARRTLSPELWRRELADLRLEEKELTKAQDRLAAKRRRLPWTKIDKDYAFTGPDGSAGLVDLFSDYAQLIVYHHMLKPNDPSPCEGCCMVADQIPHLSHLRARNTALVFVSTAPIKEIEAFRAHMGWPVPWYETQDSFNGDFDVTSGFGLNVFYRDDTDIYRTYYTTGRGVETLGTVWTLLDLTPLGRQENWEDAPEGTPQTAPYQWWRRHDAYS